MGGRHNNNRRITSVFNNPGRNKTAGELYYLERNGSENMPESMLILKIELGKMRLRELAERYGREDKRVPLLLQTPAAVRFVSVEPMLSAVDLSRYLGVVSGCQIHCPRTKNTCRLHSSECWEAHNNRPGLNWVICGGETGPGARPVHPDWVRSLRDQCQAVRVPFFFKQWGEWAPWATHLKGVDGPWDCFINPDGSTGQCAISGMDNETWLNWCGEPKDGLHIISKVGKKKAGRILDGRTREEFPGGPNV